MSTGEKIKDLQDQVANMAAVTAHNIGVLTDAMADLERRDIAQKCAIIRLAAKIGVPEETMSTVMHMAFVDSVWITAITDAFHALVASGHGAVRLRLVHDSSRQQRDEDEEIFGGDVAGTTPAP